MSFNRRLAVTCGKSSGVGIDSSADVIYIHGFSALFFVYYRPCNMGIQSAKINNKRYKIKYKNNKNIRLSRKSQDFYSSTQLCDEIYVLCKPPHTKIIYLGNRRISIGWEFWFAGSKKKFRWNPSFVASRTRRTVLKPDRFQLYVWHHYYNDATNAIYRSVRNWQKRWATRNRSDSAAAQDWFVESNVCSFRYIYTALRFPRRLDSVSKFIIIWWRYYIVDVYCSRRIIQLVFNYVKN